MRDGKVFITYENSIRGNITGVYATKRLAEKERDKRGDLDCIDCFDLKGYRGDQWEYELDNSCKYFKPHLNTIRELINCLYSLEGCCVGGLAHIVTDDNNLDDDDIQWVLEYCDKEENKDRTERGLVKLICEELLKLNMQERIYLFSHYYGTIMCPGKCCECHITKCDIRLI